MKPGGSSSRPGTWAHGEDRAVDAELGPLERPEPTTRRPALRGKAPRRWTWTMMTSSWSSGFGFRVERGWGLGGLGGEGVGDGQGPEASLGGEGVGDGQRPGGSRVERGWGMGKGLEAPRVERGGGWAKASRLPGWRGWGMGKGLEAPRVERGGDGQKPRGSIRRQANARACLPSPGARGGGSIRRHANAGASLPPSEARATTRLLTTRPRGAAEPDGRSTRSGDDSRGQL